MGKSIFFGYVKFGFRNVCTYLSNIVTMVKCLRGKITIRFKFWKLVYGGNLNCFSSIWPVIKKSLFPNIERCWSIENYRAIALLYFSLLTICVQKMRSQVVFWVSCGVLFGRVGVRRTPWYSGYSWFFAQESILAGLCVEVLYEMLGIELRLAMCKANTLQP